MQAGRQASGLAGRQPLTFEMLRCIVLDGPQSKLFSGENGVIVSECVWWRVAVLVYLREGLQALLQNTPAGAVEPKSLAHVVSVLTRAHCLFHLNEVTRVQSHLSTQLYSAATLQDFPSSGSA